MVVISKSASPLRRLAKDKRGNVLMIMGFALIPITMAAGMTVDYTRAARLKTKLDAAADAAVLAAVAEASTAYDDKTVCERAAKLFDQQASLTPQTIYSRANITLSVGTAASPNNVTYNGATNSCSSPSGPASSAASRIVSLSYSVESTNVFGSLLSRPTLPVSGRAGSEVSIAPDIDFYIALDTSPSMALPVTSAGIDNLVHATAQFSGSDNAKTYSSSFTETQKGCAFACHSNKIENYVGTGASLGETPQDNAKYAIIKESPTRSGTFAGKAISFVDSNNAFVYKTSSGKKFCYQSGHYNATQSGCDSSNWKTDTNIYYADGTFVDTYWYTRNKSITLRIDEMRRATSELVTTALDEASRNEATYKAAIYGFDSQEQFRKIYPALGSTPKLVTIAEKNPSAATIAAGNAFKAKAMSSDIDIALIDDKTGGGCPLAFCSGNNYLFTSFKGLFDGMMGNSADFLPTTSGRGTRAAGDTPQAFLFIITDGMSDEKSSLVSGLYSQGSDRTRSEITSSGAGNHQNKCDQIKARGVQIAILYTEYTAASIASDEAGQRTWVEGRIPYVESALRNCASTGYMLKVSADGDISGALQALLRKAVSKPRLVR